MDDWRDRTRRVLGDAGVAKLASSSAAVFGLGGVGSYAAEALARAGVGRLALFDKDVVELTNLNRQLYALRSTLGLPKAEVAARRILDINPEAEIEVHEVFYLPENADEFDLSRYGVVIDAVDTVTAKLELAARAFRSGVPLLSCMGTGNKTDPGRLRLSDISETSVCPLARVMRRELKARGIPRLTVVWSDEPPKSSGRTPGSVSFVPPAAGMLLAAEAVRLLLEAK